MQSTSLDPDDVAKLIARFKQAVGANDPGPKSHFVSVQHGSEFFYGTTSRIFRVPMEQLPSGLLVPPSIAKPPDSFDLMKTYVTAEEFLGRSILPLIVGEYLSRVSLETALSWSAGWLGLLRRPGQTQSSVDELFIERHISSAYAQKIRNLLRRGERALVTSQGLTFLAKLALQICESTGPISGKPTDLGALTFALLGLSEHLGSSTESSDDELVISYLNPGALARDIISNQLFNSNPGEAGRLAMFQRCWRDIPTLHSAHPRMVDLRAWYEEITGIPLDDLVALCTILWAAAVSGNSTVGVNYLNSLGWEAGRLDRTLSSIATDPNTLKNAVIHESEKFGLQWSNRAFQRNPAVLWDGGYVTVLDPNLMLDRASGHAPMFDMLERLESQGRGADMSRVRGAVATAHEIYALEILRGLFGPLGANRAFSEEQLRGAYQGKVADLAVDYGHSWIIFEVTITGLQAGTFAGTSDASVRNDVDGFLRKVRQIDNTIQNLRTDAQRLTHAPNPKQRRFFPVLVIANRYTNSLIFMTLFLERLRSEGLLAGTDVSQLEVMSIEDLDVAEGAMGEQGLTLAELLAAKAQSTFSRMSVKDYLLAPIGSSVGDPQRVNLASKRHLETVKSMFRNPNGSG